MDTQTDTENGLVLAAMRRGRDRELTLQPYWQTPFDDSYLTNLLMSF